jgi:hypothetical protein
MTTTHRSRKNTGLLSLVFPLLYLSIGALIGFVLCFSWLQSGGSPPIGSSPTTRSSLIQPVLSTRERAYQDEQDFFAIASKTKTDKVGGLHNLADCLEDDSKCTRPSCVNPRCRPWYVRFVYLLLRTYSFAMLRDCSLVRQGSLLSYNLSVLSRSPLEQLDASISDVGDWFLSRQRL